jgi:protein-L-isoaspartate(D-aspartate) O-methyltransferase
MVQPGGKVIGIEHISELSTLATKNLLKDPENKKLMDDGHLTIVTGDGRQGYVDEGFTISIVQSVIVGPYDAIHVGAAAPVKPK